MKILNILLVLLVGYLFLVFFTYFFQKKLIFYPTKIVNSPSKYLGIEEVFFETVDGKKLHGWWMETDGAEKTVIFFHGNAGNLSHRVFQMEIFKSLGLNALIFDYRGYGKSSGRIIKEQDVYNDGSAAWEFVTKKKKILADKIIIWGRSIGGAVAADVAQNKEISAVVLESALFSAEDIARKYFWYLPVRWLLRFHFETGEKVKNIHVPIFIIHSKEDEIIPFGHGEDLFDMALEPKTFLKTSGTHNEWMFDSNKEYIEGIREFLNLK